MPASSETGTVRECEAAIGKFAGRARKKGTRLFRTRSASLTHGTKPGGKDGHLVACPASALRCPEGVVASRGIRSALAAATYPSGSSGRVPSICVSIGSGFERFSARYGCGSDAEKGRSDHVTCRRDGLGLFAAGSDMRCASLVRTGGGFQMLPSEAPPIAPITLAVVRSTAVPRRARVRRSYRDRRIVAATEASP
ncbi:MAG: hypothetical protein K0R64_3132 [Novosphingobium lindaniclasticum]|nr:hypothetical protein [Novosphingobium lindaniclasticum]